MNLNEFNAKTSFFRALKGKATLALFGLAAFFAETTTLWASEGGEEASLDPMKWEPDLAIFSAIVFVILVVVLGVFAFGPIAKALDRREQAELDRRADVEKANADARDALEQYRRKLADSEEEARRILAEASGEAENRARAIVAEAREAAVRERERAVKDIETATDVALQGLAAKSAELATSLAGKILRETIDPAKHARLIEGAVQEIARQ